MIRNMRWLTLAAIVGLLALTVLNTGCIWSRRQINDILIFKAVDPLEKVFRESAFFRDIEPGVNVARGEHATLQFVVRCSRTIKNLKVGFSKIKSDKLELGNPHAGFVGYVHIGRSTLTPSRDRLVSPSGFYPDPIQNLRSIDLPRDTSQPIWVSVPIPAEVVPGVYRGRLHVRGFIGGFKFKKSMEFSIKVHPVTVESSRLWVTNWFFLAPERLALMNGGEPVEEFSDRYWELVRPLARKMAEYRQNVARISPLALAEYLLDGETYRIDFSRFDRMVNIFIEEGVIGRIEGGHLGKREGLWDSPFVVRVPNLESTGPDDEYHMVAIEDEAAQIFYSQFIPGLLTHLKEKGWDKIYMQHLADEPTASSAESYVAISNFVKQYAPGLKIVEACHSKDLGDAVDIWVPQLNFLADDFDFYKERMELGDEVWFYTCLGPQGEYANRFIELPLIKTRILHWINFRFNVAGYLHWGFNYWNQDPYDESSGVITEGGNVLPGGDSWIVYPLENGLISSIRLEAMRDGIVDYELLKMLQERNPEEAAELARQVVYNFKFYDINIDSFRQKRRRILELLSNQ